MQNEKQDAGQTWRFNVERLFAENGVSQSVYRGRHLYQGRHGEPAGILSNCIAAATSALDRSTRCVGKGVVAIKGNGRFQLFGLVAADVNLSGFHSRRTVKIQFSSGRSGIVASSDRGRVRSQMKILLGRIDEARVRKTRMRVVRR